MPAPCYTETQLREQCNLPGFNDPAQIDPEQGRVLFEGTDWQPVLNLAVVSLSLDADGVLRPYVLTGIRREETNPTHPNVVSTPTMRISDPSDGRQILGMGAAYFDDRHIPNSFCLTDVDPSNPSIIAEFQPDPTRLDTTITAALARLTRRLFAKKLGLETLYDVENAARLAQKGIYPSIGTVSLSRMVAGFSYVSDDQETGEAQYEPIVKLGAMVYCRFPKLIPAETAEYRNLTWTPAESFAKNVHERNVPGLIANITDADIIEVCVRGLCLSTNIAILGASDLVIHANRLRQGLTNPHSREVIARALEREATLGRQIMKRARDALSMNPGL